MQATLPAGSERVERELKWAMLYSTSETKHGSCKRTREEQGQEERGWQRKSPFPLSCASTSCVGRKSLIGFAMISYFVAIGFRPHKQRYFEPVAIGGKWRSPHPTWHTHAHTRLSWLSQWKTYTHPHSRSNRKRCYMKQTSTSRVYWGPFTEWVQSKSNVLSTASLSPPFNRHYCSFANSHKALFMLIVPL